MQMAERGQIIGALLDGPLALDNAISPEAAAIKKIVSPVAGRANVLVVPDLEAGNMLAKSLSFLAGADAAGVADRGARADHSDEPRGFASDPARLLRGRRHGGGGAAQGGGLAHSFEEAIEHERRTLAPGAGGRKGARRRHRQ